MESEEDEIKSKQASKRDRTLTLLIDLKKNWKFHQILVAFTEYRTNKTAEIET